MPKLQLKWHVGDQSQMTGDNEVVIDMSAAARARVLDQLAFSAALQRHMKVLWYVGVGRQWRLCVWLCLPLSASTA